MSDMPLLQLPTSWQWIAFGELLSAIDAGKSFTCVERPPDGDEYGIVKVSAVTWGSYDEDESKTIADKTRVDLRYLIQRGDLLFSRANTLQLVGASVIVHETRRRLLLSDKILRLRLPDELKRWVDLFLKSRYGRKQIEALSTGNQESMRNIGQERIRRIQVPAAPAREQRRIVSKIDELFSRIDEGEQALQRVAKLVERYRQSVLKAAVTGELTRDWREARKRAGQPVESGADLLARILKARRAAWEQAELAKLKARGKAPTDDRWKRKYKEPTPPDTADLPELPDGWVWASPEQLTGHHPHALTIGPFGSDLKVSDYKDSGVPLVFVRNIRSGAFRGDGAKYVSEQKARALSAHLVRGGDLLITKMGDPPGDVCVYPPSEPDAVITADCIKWTLSPVLRSPAFVRTVVASQVGQMQIHRITTGVAQQKVSLARFRKLAICLPGREEQGEIDDRVEVMLGRAGEMAREMTGTSSHANALRQSILKAAFSGQLVPQDPNDEPASKLLQRIAAERAAQPAQARRGRRRAAADRDDGRA